MKIIFDGRTLDLYSFGKPGFKGGTEQYAAIIAHGMAEAGHQVHVVTSDLDHDEQRGPNEYWWGPAVHPTRADVVVMIHNLEHVPGYVGQHFVLMPNGIDPWIGPEDEWASRLSAVACFSQTHVDLLTQTRPAISPDLCRVTGLGVNLAEYQPKDRPRVPGRMVWANDPTRGLHHLLPIFDEIRSQMPEAELLVAYDFDRQFDNWSWRAHAAAEQMWECRERIEQGDGVRSVGNLSRDGLVALQHTCDIHIMPSDPLNVGSQIHGLTQLEMAAAGVPLVLSDIEAFPELFGQADQLPVPGTFHGRTADGEIHRIDARDWAEHALNLMRDEKAWRKAAKASRAMAEPHDWSVVIGKWQHMLEAFPLD